MGLNRKQITGEQMMRNDVRTYIHIAHALARAYMDLFYVNMDTGIIKRYYIGRYSEGESC